MASAEGPMKVMPSRAQRSAKVGSSATKPQPTHTASARVASRASSSRSWFRYGRALAGPSDQATSASRTNMAAGSASVYRAMTRMGSVPAGSAALRSRTAWTSRIADSPRLTTAIRRKGGRSEAPLLDAMYPSLPCREGYWRVTSPTGSSDLSPASLSAASPSGAAPPAGPGSEPVAARSELRGMNAMTTAMAAATTTTARKT